MKGGDLSKRKKTQKRKRKREGIGGALI